MSDAKPAPTAGAAAQRAPMLPMEDALQRLLSQVTPLGRTESVARKAATFSANQAAPPCARTTESATVTK